MHQNKHQNTSKQHIPVLLAEVLQYLAPQLGDSYLDLTAGYGGHASAILDITNNYSDSVLVDRDENAIAELHSQFNAGATETQSGQIELHSHDPIELRSEDFLTATRSLTTTHRKFDLILADLGVSSPHLNEVSRGFAINSNGPLDMRMDQRQELTAAIIVNTYSESALSDILTRYGQEPKARQIAQLMIAHRPLQTTEQLAALASRAWPGHSRVHPATRTFQALRIAVNDELGLLTTALPLWLDLLNPGGRIAVISFHSLEDRLVKQAFAERAGDRYDAEMQLLTKRPVVANSSETVFNPRARSAKLRAAAKIKIKK
jgi:16S rRNA (cytosine1402-N4)-methyltransferase